MERNGNKSGTLIRNGDETFERNRIGAETERWCETGMER